MRQVTERCAEATIRRCVIAVLSVIRYVCIVCVCVCVCDPHLLRGTWCRGCVRVRSGASYCPYLCVDKALAVLDDA